MQQKNPWWRLVPMFHRHRLALAIIIVLGILQSLSEGIGIGLIIPLLRGLISGETASPQGVWLIDRAASLFQRAPLEHRQTLMALGLFTAVLSTAVLAYLHGVLLVRVDGNIAHDLRCRLFGRLMTIGFGTLERDRSGRLLNVLSSETARTSEALNIFVNLSVTVSTVTVYVLLLLLMSWRLTLVVAAGMLLASGVIRWLTRGVRELGQRLTLLNAELVHRMVEGIDGMQVIRAYGREPFEEERFDRASDRLRHAIRRVGYLDRAVHPIHEILVAALLLTTLLIMARGNDTSLLLVFVFVLYRLHPRVKQLEASRVRLAALSSSVEAVLSVLETVDADRVDSGTTACSALDQDIVFDQVSFRYDPADEPALRSAALRIAAGRTTALVGPSGGGKSTIIKLLLRFYDPSDGVILVDGRPLREVALESWRSQIAVVGQNGYLFNATVRENIAYGRLDASLDDIVEAARQADAHGFIERLPDKYETVLGHHGVRLSGGQQQRVSLARALVRDPRILILDEATNALDSLSENWIYETLARLKKGRTVIMIAHRFATIELADQIIVIDRGTVRERGTLEELLVEDGLFARLHRLQHRGASVQPLR